MHDKESRRKFLKSVAKFAYAAPVITTVLAREANAGLSGCPAPPPPGPGELPHGWMRLLREAREKRRRRR